MAKSKPVILSKKEWKDICECRKGQNVRIIHTTCLKKGNIKKKNGFYIDGTYYKEVNKTKFHRVAGYIDAGESGDYIRYVKFNPIWLLLLFIIAAIIALIVYINSGTKIMPIGKILKMENTHDISSTATNSMDYVSVPGFSDTIKLSKAVQNIALKNPDVNMWYIYYEVKEDGKTLCKTKLIAPGQQKDYNAYKDLDNGDHSIEILTYAASEKGYTTGEPIATQPVKIHVSK